MANQAAPGTGKREGEGRRAVQRGEGEGKGGGTLTKGKGPLARPRGAPAGRAARRKGKGGASTPLRSDGTGSFTAFTSVSSVE